MAKKISNITFMPVVETISRKFALRKEKCSLKSNQQGETACLMYMGSGTRKKKFNGTMVTQNYFFMRKNPRTSVASSTELDIREAFKAGNAWAVAARKDLTAIAINQQKYLQSQNEHKKIKGYWAGDYTISGFLRAVAISMAINGEELPQNHQLPAFDA